MPTGTISSCSGPRASKRRRKRPSFQVPANGEDQFGQISDSAKRTAVNRRNGIIIAWRSPEGRFTSGGSMLYKAETCQ